MVEIQNEFFKKYEEPNEEQLKEFSDTMDKYVEDFGYEQLEEEKKKYLVEDSRVVSNIWLYLRKPEMKKADEAL